jgi:acetyl esterase/lipase
MLAAAAAAALVGALPPGLERARAELSYQDLLKRPAPRPDARIRYGGAPSQFADLWLPPGPGPHPVAIVIHGGCWRASLPGVELMNLAAADLRRRGIAVWNIEYRRVDEPGGGYPGTFADVAQAVDLLKGTSAQYGLSLDHVVAIGHSAGGHLALWAAARGRLPRSSPLWAPEPLRIEAVVTLGGLGDLEGKHDAIASACGRGVVERLIGPPGPARPDPYADTAPAELLPLGARQVLVHGGLDTISPPVIDLRYAELAARRGDSVERRTIQNAGHFELIAPGEQAWSQTALLVQSLTRSRP